MRFRRCTLADALAVLACAPAAANLPRRGAEGATAASDREPPRAGTARQYLRLLLVDDHEVVREGLRRVFEREGEYEVVGAAASGKEAVRAAAALRPDVVLLDLRLPDTRGEDICRSLREASPRSAIVVLTTDPREEAVRASLEAGAHAYVTKSAGLKELREVLDTIAAVPGDPGAAANDQIVDHLRALIVQNARGLEAGNLTRRQQRVLELAAQGLTNREIGERLYLSESTVRFHVQNLKSRLGARTKTELVVRALELGLISRPVDG
jgi:DNA-binding NarL/FixJ family response regulator